MGKILLSQSFGYKLIYSYEDLSTGKELTDFSVESNSPLLIYFSPDVGSNAISQPYVILPIGSQSVTYAAEENYRTLLNYFDGKLSQSQQGKMKGYLNQTGNIYDSRYMVIRYIYLLS